MKRLMVIAGGSGFLGKTLAKWFSKRGWSIMILTRRVSADLPFEQREWDGRSFGDWAGVLEGAAVLVNLAGRSVNCRYTDANRTLIMDSRVESTRILAEALRSCGNPPKVWLNSSTATIYRHRFDEPNDEAKGEIGADPEAKDAFSIEVAKAWEGAFTKEFEAGGLDQVRPVILRTAMVFGAEAGGVFETLEKLTRLGLGGTMGSGRQWVSWMHAVDFCRAIEWLIARREASGIYNLCAPEPLTNRDMMRKLRTVCGKRIGLPATRWMLEIGAWLMRTETELIIKSRRVVPGRLVSEGFEFEFPEMSEALADLVGTTRQA